ncbi:MAG: hypothetical protein GXO26_02060 [Crenarchaeota archaeon]|nr:hypothetical protein [Thermoproteota archaeon]
MLTASELLNLVKDSEDIVKRVKKCGSSIELPFKAVYRAEPRELIIDVDETRRDITYEPVQERAGWYVLYPGIYIIVLPRVEFPEDVEGMLLPRSSFLRGSGWMLQGTKIDAGFRGELVMQLMGFRGVLHLRSGARVAHMLAWRIGERFNYALTGQYVDRI